MSTPREKISFIFLCDGPCATTSWRNEDMSIYWARRDALARIAGMCLWQGPGRASSVSDDCSLLFHEFIEKNASPEKEELLAAMSLSGPSLVQSLPVPTESCLISRWKTAASIASKYPQKAEIGSITSKSNKEKKPGNEVQKGVQMSFTPWREAAFFLFKSKSFEHSASSKVLSVSPAVIASRSSKNSLNREKNNHVVGTNFNCRKSEDNNMNCDSFDKRFILRSMQKQCPLEFLRKHNLAGSEDLILKKRNKASILLAYSDWTESSKIPSGVINTKEEGPSVLSKTPILASSAVDTAMSCGSNGMQRLVDTFAVLYNRSKSSTDAPQRVTVLLLHEDYPHELPVFGRGSKATRIDDAATHTACCAEDTGGRKIPISTGGKGKGKGESHRVICVLGAVRDASDSEVVSAIAAAELMGIRCVGANLGRTAEFTSKIVAALIAHALAGQLGDAVDALPSITTAPLLSAPCSALHSHHSLGDTGTGMGAPALGIEKLVPHRAGGWSWDGQSNKSVKRIKPLTSSGTNSMGGGGSNMTATDASGRAGPGTTSPSLNNGIGRCSLNVRGSVLFHAVLWLPYRACDICIDVTNREMFHTLIQTAVCTLWRSRVASEASHDVDSDSGLHDIGDIAKDALHRKSRKRRAGDTSDTCKQKCVIQPTLSLVFIDGSIASITQEQLTLAMARKRMAAPSEYQVLSSLIELLQGADPGSGLIEGQSIATKGTGPGSVLLLPPSKSCTLLHLNALDDTAAESWDASNEKPGGGEKERTSPWVRSLERLLPQGLNRKQRRKVMVVDIEDLISTGRPAKTRTLGHTEHSVTTTGWDAIVEPERAAPCLSSITYSKACACSLAAEQSSGLDCEEDGDPPRQVLVLLRSSDYCGAQGRPNPSLSSSLSLGVHKAPAAYRAVCGLQAERGGSRAEERGDASVPPQAPLGADEAGLNRMLNAWLYGKKSPKHDMAIRSPLYFRSSLFPRPGPQVQTTDSPPNMFPSSGDSSHEHIEPPVRVSVESREPPREDAIHVSPGVAVCVLQHWAYHMRLIPTLQAAAEEYLK